MELYEEIFEQLSHILVCEVMVTLYNVPTGKEIYGKGIYSVFVFEIVASEQIIVIPRNLNLLLLVAL